MTDPSAAEALSANTPVETLIGWLDSAISLADLHGVEAVTVHVHMLRLVRAALDRERAAALPTLEVERLARAMDAADPPLSDGYEEQDRIEHRAYAAMVAREYAALGEIPAETGDGS